ncbi:hypothetical protein KY285_029423 [Solanum tuberosum]|nr:hypothetical protein KY289_028475 [Solanum tuberosum]KAH0668217.1 hypothetical protein KY285_029423 [Solanum tuberosum]
MGRPFILHYEDDCIHCRSCKTRVGFIRDHLFTNIGDESFIFHTVFNVEVPEDKRYHQVEKNGRTVADTYCIKCGNLLGRKLISIDKPCSYIREGVFFISLHKVGLTNQDGGVNEQAAGANVQDGDADEQGGANEQNDEQGGGTNERNDEQ